MLTRQKRSLFTDCNKYNEGKGTGPSDRWDQTGKSIGAEKGFRVAGGWAGRGEKWSDG